jgi:putative transposase
MARPLRIEYPGTFYHVINRGKSAREIFMEDKGRQSLLDLLSDICGLSQQLGGHKQAEIG